MWLLRGVGAAMISAGLGVGVAAVPTFALLQGVPAATKVLRLVLLAAAVFLIAGVGLRYLAVPGRGLPSERIEVTAGARPRVRGWLLALLATLVVLPVAMTVQLRPFLREWRIVIGLLSEFDIGAGGSANMSGVVLVPLAGVLTPPLVELVAMAAFVSASAVLVPLLLWRSAVFSRVYLACTIATSALVIASVLGARAALLGVDAIRPFIEASRPRAAEYAQLNDVAGRYLNAVGSTAPVLLWVLCGYLAWLPAVVYSRRAQATFARPAQGPGATAESGPDLEAITRPPRFTD